MLHVVRLAHDPFAEVARLSRNDRRWLCLWTCLALSGHATVALAVFRMRNDPAEARAVAEEPVDLAFPEPPEPPELPLPRTPDSTEEAKATRVRAPSPAAATPNDSSAASEILTRPEDPTEPVNFTDVSLTGSATTARGGATSGSGSSTQASPGKATRANLGGEPRPQEPDQSRRASVAGGPHWSCPFPSEADEEGLNAASTTLSIVVDSRGTAERVTVLSDPGHGFGAAARRCARDKRYIPAQGSDGRGVRDTLVVRVRFVR
jgi:protein TonB